MLISGNIRFLTGTVPNPTNILNPTSSPVDPVTIEAEVVQTAPASLTGTRTCFEGVAATYVQYFCAVPVEVPNLPITAGLRWSGTLQITPASLPTLSGTLADDAAANRKVCRYRAAATYSVVTVPLANENLVIISAGNGTTPFACPGPDPTWPHQPAT